MKGRMAVLAVVAALAVGGCGGGGGDEKRSGGPGTYTASAKGARLTLTLPAPDDAVAEVEAYREAVGADPVVFATLELDNTGNDTEVGIATVEGVTRGGEQIELETAFIAVGEWDDEIGFTEDPELANQGVRVYNSLLNRDDALPGAKTEELLTVPVDPSEIATLFVSVGADDGEFGERVQLELE